MLKNTYSLLKVFKEQFFSLALGILVAADGGRRPKWLLDGLLDIKKKLRAHFKSQFCVSFLFFY